jgi:hypothetical protein
MTDSTPQSISDAWHTAYVIASLEYSWLCIFNSPVYPGKRFELNRPNGYSFQSLTAGGFL